MIKFKPWKYYYASDSWTRYTNDVTLVDCLGDGVVRITINRELNKLEVVFEGSVEYLSNIYVPIKQNILVQELNLVKDHIDKFLEKIIKLSILI